MEYDGNKLVKETNALGESRHYTYTPLGDVEISTMRQGVLLCYQYQKGGLLENPLLRWYRGFTYDANGTGNPYPATGFVAVMI